MKRRILEKTKFDLDLSNLKINDKVYLIRGEYIEEEEITKITEGEVALNYSSTRLIYYKDNNTFKSNGVVISRQFGDYHYLHSYIIPMTAKNKQIIKEYKTHEKKIKDVLNFFYKVTIKNHLIYKISEDDFEKIYEIIKEY